MLCMAVKGRYRAQWQSFAWISIIVFTISHFPSRYVFVCPVRRGGCTLDCFVNDVLGIISSYRYFAKCKLLS